VTGDGNPEIGSDGAIVFTDAQLPTVLRFTYTLAMPLDRAATEEIRGTVEYWRAGQPAPTAIHAAPDPLLVIPSGANHSADCDGDWAIGSSEVSRVLAYWRGGAYHEDAVGCDGYSVGPGSAQGPRHSADYQEPHWQLDGSEVNRVLAYFRSDGYRIDPSGLDGYAPGKAGVGVLALASNLSKAGDDPVLNQFTSPSYVPGEAVRVTNELSFVRAPLSLLWRPILPDGWSLLGVAGGAAYAEVIGGEIVWTGPLGADPIRMVYEVQAAADVTTPAHLRAEVEYHPLGAVNPLRAYASPELLLTPGFPALSVGLLPNGTITLSWPTDWTPVVVERADSLTPPVSWRLLGEAEIAGSTPTSVSLRRSGQESGFYRLTRQ
jgi:hypothetical protein